MGQSNPMIGRKIGKYKITGEIGRGGMGIVYQAIQTALNRPVAIKMLPHHLASATEFLSRFLREAETLARLAHENIVHVYDIEEYEGNHFIMMEYVGGPSLSAVLKTHGHLPSGMARDIAVCMARALAAAHRKGIVHRDVKPDNILFSHDGKPKLTDFGIAHAEDTRFKTQTGTTMGTPYYVSPEQAQGRQVTEQSDLYSLGIVLYEMLAGCRPFEAENSLLIFMKHIEEPAPPLLERVPELHPDLAGIVHRTLEKEPSDRIGSAEELEAQLVQLNLGETPGMALRSGFTSVEAQVTAKKTLIDTGPPSVGSKKPMRGKPTADAGKPSGQDVDATVATGPPLAADPAGEKGSKKKDKRRKVPAFHGLDPGGAAAADAMPPMSQSWIRRTFASLLPTGDSPRSRSTQWITIASAIVGAVVIFFAIRAFLPRGESVADMDPKTPVSSAEEPEPGQPGGADGIDEMGDKDEDPGAGAATDSPESPVEEPQIPSEEHQPIANWDKPTATAAIYALINKQRVSLEIGDLESILSFATQRRAPRLRSDLESLFSEARILTSTVPFSSIRVQFDEQRRADVQFERRLTGTRLSDGGPFQQNRQIHWSVIHHEGSWLVDEIREERD